MRSRIVSVFSEALASCGVPALDVASRYAELGEFIEALSARVVELGAKVVTGTRVVRVEEGGQRRFVRR